MAIATNGSRQIGLSIFNIGSFNIKTYFATEKESNEIVGVSYIKNIQLLLFRLLRILIVSKEEFFNLTRILSGLTKGI
mgnify:CR=1 FL=1